MWKQKKRPNAVLPHFPLFCAGSLNSHTFGKGIIFQKFYSVTGSACGIFGMWLYLFIMPRSVVLISTREGIAKSSQLRKLKLCGSCCFIQEVAYKRRDKCFLFLFPSPILPFSLLCPPPPTLFFFVLFFATRSSLTVASCQWVTNKMKTFKCVWKYIGEGWLQRCCGLYVIYTGAHEIWSGQVTDCILCGFICGFVTNSRTLN